MSSTKRVNLALQGGGSHGAFTHSIADPASLAPLGAVSKFNIEPGIPEPPVRSRARGRNRVAGRFVRLGRRHEQPRHPRAFSVN
jgi:hypothetical protein